MTGRRIATFLGGVASTAAENTLAYECGVQLGSLGFRLQNGGYNGTMEQAARGARAGGAEVVAITLAGKEEWGELNPFVDEIVYAPDFGARILRLIGQTDAVVAVGGGIGTLHEVTAALWYASNIRRIPVILVGERAGRLLSFLTAQRWVYESATRPIDFIALAASADQLPEIIEAGGCSRPLSREVLRARVRRAAFVEGPYHRADGSVLQEWFDPFQLFGDVNLAMDVANALAAMFTTQVDAVAGVSLGGVPLASLVAQVLALPLLVTRPEPKPYGSLAHVEGAARAGSRAFLIDDVVRDGDSMIAAVAALGRSGVTVNEAACVVSRGAGGLVRLGQSGVDVHALIKEI